IMEYHNERSRGIIRRLLDEGGSNAYTILKNGVRKMIYQTVWRKPDGALGGLVELSMVIPDEMPHYVRE
ncbi:MAG: PAS sensor protein, partial [Duncaniella sp.]|nr:PAS sensor protein [Duncaniella sp.]